MKIVVICGVGVGTSAILKLNTERSLAQLEIQADVSASDISSVHRESAHAQIILTSPELVERIGKTTAEVVVINNYFDLDEISRKLESALE